MGFRQRWAFTVLVIVTFFIVFFSFDPSRSKCKCKIRCPPPSTCKCKGSPNDSRTEWNRQQRVGHQQRPEFRKEGWVLDCVTWNKKWELPTLEADPHDFMLDERIVKDGESPEERLKAFREIYKKEYWPSKDPSYFGLQCSGQGALLRNAQSAAAALQIILTKMKIHMGKQSLSILDMGCGDLQWMSKFLITRDDIEYTGMDIIPEIINSHKQQFENLPNSHFMQLDVVTTPVNESYDIIILRDVLQFLHQSDALRALQHLSNSGSKFLLATSFPDTTQNGDITRIPLKDRRFSYNLELPPFLIEPPICSSYDWNVEHLALWALPIKQKYEY